MAARDKFAELLDQMIGEHVERVLTSQALAAAREVDPWLSSAEAAEYLGIARSTVHDLVSAHKLPRVGGKKTRLVFRQSVLDAYLASRGRS
jgi:excisionase family DNA binding protein